jgi:hypothetical protein
MKKTTFRPVLCLVAEFEKERPDFKGRIYWETIPPGLLIKQIEAGGTINLANMTWTAKADAYFAGLKKVKQSIASGLLVGPAVPDVTNTPAIMVPEDNPAHVTGLAVSCSVRANWNPVHDTLQVRSGRHSPFAFAKGY